MRCIENGMNENSSADDAQFLTEVAAESIGWLPLDEGAYLHVGDPEMAGMNVLWVGW